MAAVRGGFWRVFSFDFQWTKAVFRAVAIGDSFTGSLPKESKKIINSRKKSNYRDQKSAKGDRKSQKVGGKSQKVARKSPLAGGQAGENRRSALWNCKRARRGVRRNRVGGGGGVAYRSAQSPLCAPCGVARGDKWRWEEGLQRRIFGRGGCERGRYGAHRTAGDG